MHIIFSKSEKNIVEKIAKHLPEKTTLFEKGQDNNNFQYEVNNGSLTIIKDFADHERENFHKNEIQPEITKESFVDWWMNVYLSKGYDPPTRIYRLYFNKLYDFFKYISMHSGYWVDTSQQVISLKCDKKADPQEILDELNYFLPFIKPVEGMKKVHLYEYTLSEYGVFALCQEKNSEPVLLIMTTHGRDSIEKEFNSWLEAIKYCQKNHYYPNYDEDEKEYNDEDDNYY